MTALLPLVADAHGTQYEVITNGVVGVRAMYDNGAPLAKARTLVFPPGHTEPAFEGRTNAEGVFCFFPDKPGLWILQIRTGTGHGMRINLDIDDTDQLADSAMGTEGNSLSTAQKILMAGCVLWGFLGTALFVKSKPGKRPAGGCPGTG